MALPVVPFIVGAAVGAASTYLAKDKEARADVWNTIQGFIAGVTPNRNRPHRRERLEQSVESTEQAAESAAEAVQEGAEAFKEKSESAAESVKEDIRTR